MNLLTNTPVRIFEPLIRINYHHDNYYNQLFSYPLSYTQSLYIVLPQEHYKSQE